MELIVQLFGEAWEHRRRRHRALRMSLAVGLIAAGVAAGALMGRPRANPAASSLHRAAASRVVARSYSLLTPDQQLGDHCAVLNSVACDTLTLQLQLTHPARSVVASMGSRTVRLTATPRADGFPVPDEITLTRSFGPWTVFSGELFPALAPHAVAYPTLLLGSRDHRPTYVDVRLLITYPNGQRVNATVPLAPTRGYQAGGAIAGLRLSPDSSPLLVAHLRAVQHAVLEAARQAARHAATRAAQHAASQAGQHAAALRVVKPVQ